MNTLGRIAKSIAVCVVMISTFVFTIGLVAGAPTTHAAATTKEAGKSTCVVHEIRLHKNATATVKCARWSTDSVAPSISRDYCKFYDSSLTLEIYSNTNGDYCFYGQGYIGFSGIYGVAYIASYNGGYGWVEYYQPPYLPGSGIHFNFGSDSFYGNPPFNGNQKITQVDVIGYNCILFC